MNRLNYIRQEEKKYHDLCYEQYKLFETGSWLYKPVKTVMDLMDYFEEKTTCKYLISALALEEIVFQLPKNSKY